MESGELKACNAGNLGRSALVVLAALALVACTRISGVVLERGTEKPMANAFVVLKWIGSADLIVQTASRCYRAQVTQTDAQGRFSFPLAFSSGKPVLNVYLPNYESTVELGTPSQLFLDVRRGTRAEKFRAVARKELGGGCDGATDDKAFIPLEKARALEMKELAQTDEEKHMADAFLSTVGASSSQP